jgi:hypothetical protein
MADRQCAVSRRDLLKASAAATFTIIPRRVLGGAGRPSANERLNIAAVGVGGMGASCACQAAMGPAHRARIQYPSGQPHLFVLICHGSG